MIREPYAYICPLGCGYLWRDNGDSTMSLFNANQKSCKQEGGCEWRPLGKLLPLYIRVDANTGYRSMYEDASITCNQYKIENAELCARLKALEDQEPIAYARQDTVVNWKGQILNTAWMFSSPVGLLNAIPLYTKAKPSTIESVFLVSNKTSCFTCATREDAEGILNLYPPSVSGGMIITESPIVKPKRKDKD